MSGVLLSAIPEELQSLPQWVLWKLETRDGKATKIPFQTNRRVAASDNPATWTTFEKAVTAHRLGGFSGIGFVFKPDGGIVGVDFDHVLDPQSGALSPWAERSIAELASYAERTPSGEGFHVICKGRWPGPRHKIVVQRRGVVVEALEGYDSLRFFTFTGQHVEGTPLEVRPAQDALDALYTRHFPPEQERHAPQPARAKQPVNLDDAALLKRMFISRNGDDIRRLWEGDAARYGSHSEADLALVSHLVFWCGGDAARIDALFRQSALYREKWEREDYRKRTIALALSGPREFYSPSRKLPRQAHHPKRYLRPVAVTL